MHQNLTWLGPPTYTAEEVAFARALQKSTGKEEKGMTAAVLPISRSRPTRRAAHRTSVT